MNKKYIYFIFVIDPLHIKSFQIKQNVLVYVAKHTILGVMLSFIFCIILSYKKGGVVSIANKTYISQRLHEECLSKTCL